MKQKEVFQLSYEKGIIENIRQNAFSQKGTMDSVLYLQNFNPNLETLSLVVRPGEITDTSKNFLNIEQYTDIISNIPDYIQHFEYLQTSNPLANDTLLLFIKRHPDTSGRDFYNDPNSLLGSIEATGIIAYVPDPTQNDAIVWQEPFQLSKTYPGWYPIGYYQDSTRFSESILFVTRLEDLTKIVAQKRQFKLFPCYVWKYWDLTKKRDENNQYLNGITLSPDITDKTEYTAWRVKNPSMMLFRDKQAKAYSVHNNSIRDMEDNFVDLSNDYAPISLIFWQSNLYEDQYHETTYQDYNWNNVLSDITMETLDLAKYNDKYIADLQTSYTLYTNPAAAWGPYTSIYSQLYGSHIKKYSFHTEYMFRQSIDRIFDVLLIGEGYSDSDKTKYDSKNPDGMKISTQFLLPNYMNANLPRPFIYSEKIPFVLTAKVDGTEVVLLKDTYEIREGNGFSDNFSNAQTVIPPITYNCSQGSEIYNSKSTNTDKQMLVPLEYNGDDSKDMTKSFVSVLCNGSWQEVKFTIRISPEGMKYIIDNDISSLKLYVSKPDDTKTILKSLGSSIIPIENTSPYYGKPKVSSYQIKEDLDDYLDYRLVKEFLIDGRGDIIDDYKTFDGDQSSKTNAWHYAQDNFSNKYGYWAIPQKEGTLDPMSDIHSGGDFDFSGSATNEGTGSTWTPDFVLWDYPYNTTELVLGGSGKYYEGIGARCITSIKGRTFIGGVYDKDGIEEQSKVRYSIVQNGIISKDIFYKEDWLSFGHAPITALLEFREQLVVFNKEAWYRMLLHDITDVTSWEMLEAVEGSGTFSSKTVINTPIGFVYLHESGVMVSEGNIARNLTNDPSKGRSILAIYQSMILGSTYMYDDLVSTGHFPTVDGYNKWAELIYDVYHREIIIKSPVQTTTPVSSVIDIDNCNAEYRLIFNIENQNWRAELYDREGYDREQGYPVSAIPLITTWSSIGRLTLSYLDLLTVRYQEMTNRLRVMFGKKDIESYEDELSILETQVIDGSQTEILQKYNIPIVSSLITHEIGNSQDDCLLHSVLISLVSTSKDENDDPFFGYELRNREWHTQGYMVDNDPAHNQSDGYVDLIQMNREAKGNGSIFDMNVITPEGINGIESFSDNEIPIRESMILNTPRQTQFRRMRFKWLSTKVAKLKSIKIFYILRKRRRQ